MLFGAVRLCFFWPRQPCPGMRLGAGLGGWATLSRELNHIETRIAMKRLDTDVSHMWLLVLYSKRGRDWAIELLEAFSRRLYREELTSA